MDDTDAARFSIQPLTILGVTGPFSVLAENIYSLCEEVFKVLHLFRLGLEIMSVLTLFRYPFFPSWPGP